MTAESKLDPVKVAQTEEPVSREVAVLRERSARLKYLRAIVWVVAVTAGLLQALSVRFFISGDGNSYLDVAGAYLHHDFVNAINGYWSPLYSWLAALVFWILQPNAYWETTITHLLDLAGLLLALRAFEFFVRAFLDARGRPPLAEANTQLPEFFWWLLCYGLFLSTMLEVLTLEPTSPDAWTWLATFLAMGLILKIALNRGGLFYFVALGSVLGFGYLTKHYYFPLAFVFIAVAWLGSCTLRKNLVPLVCALLAFTLVAGPFVVVLSLAKHRITFNDASRINYAFFMDQIRQPMFFWQGGDGSGTPRHAARIILASPKVFEFATPISGSFPPWYDPSYWLEGVTPHFRLRNEVAIARQSVGALFQILTAQLEYLVALTALVFCNAGARRWLAALRHEWFVWFPSAAACLAFSSVLIEPRYVASFLVILWISAFAAILASSSAECRRLASLVILAAVFATGIKTVKYAVSDGFAIPNQVNDAWNASQKLKDLGAHAGDRVALIGLFAEQHFLRLAQVKAVAELSYSDDWQFWTGGRELQDRVFAAFASTGSKFVVAVHPPVTAIKDGWVQLGNTDYYAHALPVGPHGNL